MKTDTKILASEFRYVSCTTVQEVLELLARNQDQEDARILAGGTDLLVKMKLGDMHCKQVIYISSVAELHDLSAERDCLKIGATTTLRELETSQLIKTGYSALFEAIHAMAAVSVKNMATIGGNLCNGSPAADTAPPLLVFDAVVTLASKTGTRQLPMQEFFRGPGKTARKNQELLTDIRIPVLSETTGSSFLKLGRVAADIAKINVAVLVERSDHSCSKCRIAFGSVAPVPIRIPEAEDMLTGRKMTAALIKAAAATAAQYIKPITDNRSTSSYRQKVSSIILEEALTAAWQRSGGEL